MAKKKFDDDFLSELDGLQIEPEKPKQAAKKPVKAVKVAKPAAPKVQKPTPPPVERGRRGKDLSEMRGLSARDVADATGDKMVVGNYKRKQILIPPNQIEYITQKARELSMSQLALYRWMIDYALSALEEGIEPDVVVVEVRGEAKKSHFTS